MGACYSIKLKLAFRDNEKDLPKAVEEMRKYIEIHDGKGVDFNLEKWKNLGVTLDTFENLLRIYFGGWDRDYWDMNIKRGRKWLRVLNDFDASYGWESIMLEIFDILTPFLADKSEMFIYPDEDYDHLIIRDGKCVMVH